MTVSLTAETDYRLRGVSLTNGRPDVRLGVGYDHASGAYAGAALIAGKAADGSVQALGHTAYLGYARRVGRGLTLDVGATDTRVASTVSVPFTVTYPTYVYSGANNLRYTSSYREAYLGVIRGQTNARLYLSPDYLGSGRTTAYLEVGSGLQATSRARLFWQAGLLAPLEGGAASGPDRLRTRYDMRAGVSVDLGPAQVQLTGTATGPKLEYPRGYPRKRYALVVSASAYF